jgi:hypothetical protein
LLTTYTSWQPDDPQIELILKAVKNHKANTPQPAEASKAEEPEVKAVPKPVVKKTK